MSYQQRENPRFAHVVSWLTLLVALGCLGLVAVYTPLMRSTYDSVFKALRGPLPALTELLLSIPPLFFPVTAGCVGFACVWMQFVIRDKHSLAIVYLLVIVVCCLLLVLYREFIELPMIGLIDGLRSK